MFKDKEVRVKLSEEADNVWRIELADRWRLIYTITGNEVEIITFVMDIFNHRDYDKVFGYKH